MLESFCAREAYPTIRWNFRYKDFIVVGVPDGLTREMAYEFKSTRRNSYIKNILPVAQAQADLYGCFFRRGRKRVQLYVRETGETKTWESGVDEGNAERALDGLTKVAGGEILPPPRDERRWKCKGCAYKQSCKNFGGTLA